MNIRYFIKKDFIIAGPFAAIADLKHNLVQSSAIVIMEEGTYFGVLTANDILRKPHILAYDCLHAKTGITSSYSIDSALQMMEYEKTDVLPVFDKEEIIGLVFKNDILEYLRVHNNELELELKNKTKWIEEQNSEFRKKIEQQKGELERIIEQRTKELIDLVETKDKFLRIIAHELRNPFTTIVGLLNLLLKNFRSYDIEKVELYLTHLYRSATITFDLLENLLKWLNTNNNCVPFNPEKYCISKLLAEEILSTSFFAEQKQIIVTNNIHENVFAYVDINMVKTVFRNLLNNAIKYTEPKGSIFISSNETEQFVEITVKDNGIGLSPEIIEKLFKVEGINSLQGTANETGSGLGLLLCKEFVEIEGGKIWVESILNNGTEFKFTLPKFSKNQEL